MVYWKPLVKARVNIMAAILIAVAATASRMMKREKDRCRLKAMRRAMKEATFNRHGFSAKNNLLTHTNKSFLHFCANLERIKYYRMKIFAVLVGSLLCLRASAQTPDSVYTSNIATPQLFLPGNQARLSRITPQYRRSAGIAVRRPGRRRQELLLYLSIVQCGLDAGGDQPLR